MKYPYLYYKTLELIAKIPRIQMVLFVYCIIAIIKDNSEL